MTSTYVFGHTWDPERARLGGLEWALDPGTEAILDAVGVDPAWRCLEAGAGTGTTASWLLDRAAHVTATDVETKFLEPLAARGCEVLAHDLLADPLPDGTFDLAHARWLLHWLPDPDAALRALAGAVRPGGWVVVEEPDVAGLPADVEPEVFRRVVTSWLGVLQGLAGVRLTLGRELPRRMRAAGLVDVGAQARTPFLTGATPLATGFLRLGIAKVREPMLAGGAVTTEDLAAVDGLLDDPAFDALFLTTVAAQGRRP